jgi:hypothetical protein
MESQVLDLKPRALSGNVKNGSPVLKVLRERRKVSRTQLSNLTQLSTYQVEGLEGKGTQNQLDKVILYIKALGYRVDDVLNLMDSGLHETEVKFPRGALGKPRSETSFQEGIKLSTYLNLRGNFLGLLELAVGKKLGVDNIPESDLVLGIVREGILVIDIFVKQTVYKKDSFFILPGNLAAEFLNGDSFTRTSILLFTVKHPR